MFMRGFMRPVWLCMVRAVSLSVCVCVCVCVCEVDVDGYRSFCFADDWCFFFTLMMVVYCAVKCELITCTCVLAMGLVGTKRVIFFFFFSVHLPSIVVNTWVSLAKTK